MTLTSLLRGPLPICVALAGSAASVADSEFVIPSKTEAARVNDNTVGIVFTHEELYHRLVHDLENELEIDSGLRIVPIMGKNHVQSVYDLLYLKGIDLALVRADAIEFVRREGDMRSVGRVTSSLAKLSEEKIVVLAGKDYASIDALDGQTVGLGLPGSGEYVTGTLLLDALGVEVEPVETDSTRGVERVLSGELAAMVYLLRPADAVQTGDDLAASEAIAALDEADGVHVLPLPENDELASIYRPTTLAATELPGLIADGASLPSYSVDVVLAAYDFPAGNPRLDRQKRFVAALVDGLDGLRSGAYQPAWSRVDLSEETPNVSGSSLVAAALAERASERETASAAAKLAQERASAEERAERIAELQSRRDELASRLDSKLDEADVTEIEPLLEQLDTLLRSASGDGEVGVGGPAETLDESTIGDAEDAPPRSDASSSASIEGESNEPEQGAAKASTD